MGAENSVLEGCQWGEEAAVSSLDWNLQHAETKDGRHVTVFEPKKSERKYNEMLQRLAQSLKTLRHPSILRFMGVGRMSDGCQLVTEHVVPLISVVDKLSAYEICAGLHDVMDAVSFLHEKVGVSHNSISLGAVFVARDGGWRLGELQHACPFASATSEYLDASRAFREQGSLAPEEKQGKVEVKDGQGHVRDVYALGVLAEQLIDSLRELGEFTKMFEQRVSACLSADPSLRPTVLTLRNDSLFQNDFVQILSFLKNVALKTAEEKTEFFSGLLPRLLALPENLVGCRLAVPLLSRFVLLDDTAVSHVIPHLLAAKSDVHSEGTPQGVVPLLSEAVFRTHVIPELQKIIRVHDAHIRLILLRHSSSYAHHFDEDILRNEIFPQVLLGLRDTNDAIVAASLHALADLVPLLGGDMVIGGQRKTFFFHGLPKFSAHGQSSGNEKGRSPTRSPTSVIDVMEPLKSISNGKPLLKDLATLSRKPKGDPEQEKKKMAEREHRREEAKLRREERQQRMKQAPRDEVTDRSTPIDAMNSLQITRDIQTENTVPFDLNNSSDSESYKHSGDEIVKGFTEEADNRSREASSQEEWSDWDDAEADSALKSREDAIGDEIEAELAHMSGVSRPVGVGGKVQTSPDPYRVGSPKVPVWEDADSIVIQDDSRIAHEGDVISDEWKSSDKISADECKTFHSSAVILSEDNIRSSDFQDISSDSTGLNITSKSITAKPTLGKGLKLTAKKKTTPTTAAKNVKPQKSGSAGDLGLGYDIKSIELTAVKPEMDFFADMVPDIKPGASKSALELLGGSAEKDKPTASPVKQSSSLFIIAADGPEDASGGWGEDADWGDDDF